MTDRHRRYKNKSGRQSQDTFADLVKFAICEIAFIILCGLWIFSK